MSERVAGKTKHGEITIDQMAEMQPGMAKVMDEMAECYYYAYYAAKGGNWRLSQHEISRVRAAMHVGRVTRPKYAADLDAFEREFLDPLGDAIRLQDWKRFEEEFWRSVEASDSYHDKSGHDYIRFTLPQEPPAHMHLGPPGEFRRKMG